MYSVCAFEGAISDSPCGCTGLQRRQLDPSLAGAGNSGCGRVVAPDGREMQYDHVRIVQMLGQPLGRDDGRVELGSLA